MGELHIQPTANGVLLLRLSGPWRLAEGIPLADEVLTEIKKGGASAVSFDTSALSEWDTALPIFLSRIAGYCSASHIAVDPAGLPGGATRLLQLASAVPERSGMAKGSKPDNFLEKIGDSGSRLWNSFTDTLEFIGEIGLSFSRLISGRASFRRQDMWVVIQECGAAALPIVSLISLLVGLILAFVGSIQLKTFGAQIYIADLVGIAMVRAMGAIMTGIIMAGRTGASFAARIGTMEVNEEIDALKTAGISPIDFLVLPRIAALALMLPLLTLYADVMGMIGGMFVGVFGFDITITEYLNKTRGTFTAVNLYIGLISSFVYGILVAIAGCMKGIRCGRSASAVGDSTTSAVVTGIVSIIVATAIITVICNVFGV